MLKAIIFDFDGVICESVEAKIQAFRKLFQDYPHALDRIVKYHMDNGGLSRFVKFEYIYKEFLKKELTQAESNRLSEKFTEYCYEGVVNAPYVKGAYAFLKSFYQKYALFVVSGTPETEMTAIIKERQLEDFFKGVYGSPRLKDEIIRDILKKNGWAPHEAVFVGDSMNDEDASFKTGVRFIGRLHDQYPNPFRQKDDLIKDFHDLEKII